MNAVIILGTSRTIVQHMWPGQFEPARQFQKSKLYFFLNNCLSTRLGEKLFQHHNSFDLIRLGIIVTKYLNSFKS
jgi:hypothetical protein